MKEAQEKLEQLKILEAKKADLLHQLECSLAIQSLWPEAFACGSVSTNLSGNNLDLFNTNSHHKFMREKALRNITFIVKRSDGERRTWTLDQVPYILRRGHGREEDCPL